MKKIIKSVFIGLPILLLSAILIIYFGAYAPDKVEEEKVVCKGDAPELKAGAKLKVLVWNVQYMASKNYVFYYDLPAGDGPDTRPSPEHIKWTVGQVARVIKDENPDLILLQELNDGAANTYKDNQLLDLLKALPAGAYPCHAHSFYWKAPFVPHPSIMGSVGMKLGTLSRYKITKAVRHALPPTPADFLSRRMGLHRAILNTTLPVAGGKELIIMNTHLDAFAAGTDHMARQVNIVKEHVMKTDQAGLPWVLAGDFNLLPPGFDRSSLHPDAQTFYNKETEITPLFDAFASAATRSMLTGPKRAAYFTQNSNNPRIKTKPDRTIDYIFYSKLLKLKEHRVRKKDTMNISDHLPLIAEFTVP